MEQLDFPSGVSLSCSLRSESKSDTVSFMDVVVPSALRISGHRVRHQRGLLPLLVTASLLSPLPVPWVGQPARAVPTPPSALSPQSFVASAVARSGPAVVTLETQRTVRASSSNGLPQGLLMDPFFQQFFGMQGQPAPRSRVERGQGSGVIFDAKGLVLTNAHVVENADQVVVGLPDGRRVSGQVVGQDSVTDLAVVKLEGERSWPTAPLGNSDRLRVGDWAIAVGNPFGLENTVTLGIVSNLNRNVSQLGIQGKRLDLIQTDAAINPGNSGGPLLNSLGQLVGVNTAIYSPSGGSAGIGFAIPVNMVREVVPQLIAYGKMLRPVLGVELASDRWTRRYGIEGVAVVRVLRGLPAATAGIEGARRNGRGEINLGDVIVQIEDEPIRTQDDYLSALERYKVGDTIEIITRRGDQERAFSVTLSESG